MKLKKVLAVCLATAMTFSMVACGGASTDTTTPADTSADTETEAPAEEEAEAPAEEEAEAPAEEEAEAPAEDGALTYSSITLGEDYTDLTATIKWLHHKTDRAEDGTIDKMIAEFNKDYPNITVEAEAVTDYAEDALLRLSTGDWGDIMFIPAVDKADYATYFMPLDDYDTLSQTLNFVDAHQVDGKAYGIPYMANAQGVVYNKAVFEKAGITTLPTTPDEFIADLQLIKDNTDAIPLYTNYAAG